MHQTDDVTLLLRLLTFGVTTRLWCGSLNSFPVLSMKFVGLLSVDMAHFPSQH